MKIVLANDHVGLAMKQDIATFIQDLGHEIIDIGTHSSNKAEYPIYGRMAAEAVASGEADRAILICGTGFGIALAANTVTGIRCVNCTEPYTATLSRQHNNANALALGARVVGVERAKMIVELWLKTDFDTTNIRHAARVDMLVAMKACPAPGTYALEAKCE